MLCFPGCGTNEICTFVPMEQYEGENQETCDGMMCQVCQPKTETMNKIDDAISAESTHTFGFMSKPGYWQWRFGKYKRMLKNNDWARITWELGKFTAGEVMRFVRMYDLKQYEDAAKQFRVG